MIILGVDTSGKNGSIALAHVPAGQGELEILEVVGLAGGTFSAQLVPQIAGLLVKHAYKKSDIAGFAVVSAVTTFWLNFERPVTQPGQLAGVPAE